MQGNVNDHSAELQARFDEVDTTVLFEPMGFNNDPVYILPPTFRALPLGTPTWSIAGTINTISAKDLCLHASHRDVRFPLHLAILEGDLSVVKAMTEVRPELLSKDAMGCAIRSGHMHLVEYFVRLGLANRPPTNEDTTTYDCERSRDDPPEAWLDSAAVKNNLPLLQYLHQHEIGDATTLAMDAAIRHGNLDMVRFLHDQRTEGCTEYAWDDAVSSGHVDVLKFLFAHRTEGCSEGVLAGADFAAHPGLLTILLDQDNEPTIDAAYNVAVAGKLDLLQLLLTTRGEKGSLASWTDVAAQGHLHVLKWLANVHGKPGDLESSVPVASLDLVAYLHQVGNDLRHVAPQSLPVAEFLLQHGIDVFSNDQINAVVKAGHLDIVQFVQEKSPMSGVSKDAMDIAAGEGWFAIVKYLHTHRSEGCTTQALDDAAANGHLDVVQFLTDHRTEGCTTEALDMAATNGHLEIVQWLHHHTTAGCTKRAVTSAASNDHVEVVDFLARHRSEGGSKHVYSSPLAKANLTMVQCLHAYWPSMPVRIPDFELQEDSAVERRHATVFYWLLQQKAKLDVGRVLALAARFGHVDVVHYIMAERMATAHMVNKAVEVALNHNTVNVLQCIWTMGKEWVDTSARLRQGRLMVTEIEWACEFKGPYKALRDSLESEFDADELLEPVENEVDDDDDRASDQDMSDDDDDE
ncbi:Aste57867_19810 [Aphanomyces stellatus]|uniref:Aste57867_19810 protein n=1 Tax=Aphanomyces stellatus TaxID=120398 RepID=A0A485LEN0_9STRA|nr:hypothetical protein As57867_019745 [Aphanomyces stellatus]VFT96508.1 Aste57867_19810 [Aphanomyces stellatus]